MQSTERCSNVLRYPLRHLHWIGSEVGVTGGRLYLRVAKQLANHRQPLARGDSSGREGVSQIVDAGVLQADAGADSPARTAASRINESPTACREIA